MSKEYHKEYHKKWYQINKINRRNQIQLRKDKTKVWIVNYKKDLVCSICGENHPATLDFHHRDRELKDNSIAVAVRDGWSIDRLKLEISKCDVLCSNCHRKLHYDEKYN